MTLAIRTYLLTFLLLCFFSFAHAAGRVLTAQDVLSSADYLTADHLSDVRNADLSSAFYNPDYELLGVIGDDFHRLRLHYISIHKNPTDPFLYNISAAAFWKNHIQPFNGTLRLTNLRANRSPSPHGYQRYILAADVSLFGPVRQDAAGIIRGTLLCCLYRDGDSWFFDDLDYGSPSFSNHQFFGSFSEYADPDHSLSVYWGVGRIPNSKHLDSGKDRFLPDSKYLRNGWASYEPALYGNDDALEEEERFWWNAPHEVRITSETKKIAGQTFRASIFHNGNLQQVVNIHPDFMPVNPKDIGLISRKDINGDQHPDLLVYLGNDGEDDHFDCFLWNGTHYVLLPSFRRIPNPEVSTSARCVFSSHSTPDGNRVFGRYTCSASDAVLSSSVTVSRNGRFTETSYLNGRPSVLHSDVENCHLLSHHWIRFFDAHPLRP